MNILIVGGSRFQGLHLVKGLLERGHAVTVFHRGTHTITPQHGLIDLIGNRDVPADLARLATLEFDTCIDTCAYFPAQVDLLAGVLRTGHYCLISSAYVYKDCKALLAESAPLDRQFVAQDAPLTPQNYGTLKGMCEERARHHFGHGSLIIRPSVIIGPGDHTERMSFWMRMIGKHRKRLVLHGIDQSLQLLDVRDLAQFTVSCVEAGRGGSVNVCGEVATFDTIQNAIARISGEECTERNVWIGEIAEHGISLPYLDHGRTGTYDRQKSLSWGFTGHKLDDSLYAIYQHEKQQDFAIGKFRKEESAVLELFS